MPRRQIPRSTIPLPNYTMAAMQNVRWSGTRNPCNMRTSSVPSIARLHFSARATAHVQNVRTATALWRSAHAHRIAARRMSGPDVRTRAAAPPESPHAAALRRGFPRLRVRTLDGGGVRTLRTGSTRGRRCGATFGSRSPLSLDSRLTHLVLDAGGQPVLDHDPRGDVRPHHDSGPGRRALATLLALLFSRCTDLEHRSSEWSHRPGGDCGPVRREPDFHGGARRRSTSISCWA